MLSFIYQLLLSIWIISAAAADRKSGSLCTQPNGNSGVCVAFAKCASLVQQVRQQTLTLKELENYKCGFEGSVEISCCSSDEILSTRIELTSTTTSKPLATDRKCKKVCDKYLNDKLAPLQDQVWNGNEAFVSDFPHTCLIRYSESSLRCGGTLISDRWVLTAAHCRIEIATEVLLGTDDLSPTQKSGITVAIEDRIVHESHNDVTKHNDIALIKLVESVKFSSKIFPACLYSNNNGPADGVDLIVTGFGKDHILKTAGLLLLQGRLQVSPTSRCYDTYIKRTPQLEIISSQICANGFMTDQDACQGDSGGPLSLLLSETKRISAVVGIVSFAVGCGSNDGVYTRVSSYLDWIEGHVWPGDV